jgi:hypothetical protein
MEQFMMIKEGDGNHDTTTAFQVEQVVYSIQSDRCRFFIFLFAFWIGIVLLQRYKHQDRFRTCLYSSLILIKVMDVAIEEMRRCIIVIIKPWSRSQKVPPCAPAGL